MTPFESAMPKSATKNIISLNESCNAVGEALKKGDIGDTVTAIQHLILRYYGDVGGRADESFESAKK